MKVYVSCDDDGTMDMWTEPPHKETDGESVDTIWDGDSGTWCMNGTACCPGLGIEVPPGECHAYDLTAAKSEEEVKR